MVVKVTVVGLRGDKMEIDLCDTEEQFESITVLQLKEEILKRQPDCGDPEYIRLIFTDKLLDEDSALLSAYGIQHMSVIHMVVRVPGGSVYPWTGHGGMGDKGGKNRSMERLASV
ncbi:uncharacterized protein LOC144459610 [Epinephelus lanceolatus]